MVSFSSIQELLHEPRKFPRDLAPCFRPVSAGYACYWRRDLRTGRMTPWPASAAAPRLPASVAGAAGLAREFGRLRREFLAGADHAAVARLVASRPAAAALARVGRVVAFGCGALAWGGELSPHVMVQHALVLALRDLVVELRRGGGGGGGGASAETATTATTATARPRPRPPPAEIPCYFREPSYSADDAEVLRGAGAVVLDNQKAFLEVDDTALVVAIAPSIPVKQVIADIARPAAMLWYDDKDEWARFPGRSEPVLS